MPMGKVLRSERRFQLWLYTASHSQLLIRSVDQPGSTERIEVLFIAVVWMALPSNLRGLVVTQLSPAAGSALLAEQGAPITPSRYSDQRVYLFETEGSRGTVVAAAAFVHRDHLPPGEPSAFYEGNLSVGVHLRP
jgi:hypothetical protein